MSPRTFVTRGAALLALASIGLAACESKTVITPQPVPLTVTVSPSAVTLTTVGAKASFVALVSGGETGQAAQGVNWSSSNTAVATVDASGNATAVANGTATIIATSKADATKQGAGVVTVNLGGTTQNLSISLSPPSATIGIGQTQTFIAIVSGGTSTTDRTYTCTSSNTAVATVGAGCVVTGVAAGTASIVATATADATVKAAASLTVSPNAVPVVTVSPTSATISKGDNQTFTAIVTGGVAGSSRAVTWRSSNTSIATINATTGVATGVAAGTASIIAVSVADTLARSVAQITVTEPIAPTLSISDIKTNAGTPVDVNNVNGQINVYLTADVPTGTVVTQAVVSIDGKPVCTQSFTGGSGSVNTQAANASLTIICPISTQAYDTLTGTPDFMNGPHQLSAVLEGPVPGGSALSPLATTTQALIFNNLSFIALKASASKNAVANGIAWKGGDVTVIALPVLYSAPALNTLTVFVGAELCQKTVSVTAPGPQTFVCTQAQLGSPNGPQGPVDITATSTTTDNTVGPTDMPTALEIQPLQINLDEQGPTFEDAETSIPANGGSSLVFSAFGIGLDANDVTQYWLNASSMLTLTGLLGADATVTDNGGVNTNTVTIQVAPAGTSNYATATTVAALGNMVPGSEVLKITICDQFNNCRTATSKAFGVDLIVPALTYNASTPANLHVFTTCGTTGAVSVAAVDTGSTVPGAVSGLTGNFMTYTVSKNGAAATNTASALTNFPIDTVQAYYAITPTVTDVAGNTFSLPTRLYLVDCVAPVVGPIGVTPIPLVKGGTYTVTASVTDNVDLDSNRLLQHFTSGDAFEVASNTLGEFGPPLLTAANATFTVTPFIASIQLVANLGTPGTGNLADAIAVQQWDQAGLSAANLLNIAPYVTPPAAFDFGSGTHAVSAFTLTAGDGQLKAAATTGFGITPPFSYLLFFVQVNDPLVGNVWVPIPGQVTTGFIEQGTGDRTTTYSKAVTLATANYAVLAIDANGNALMATTSFTVPTE